MRFLSLKGGPGTALIVVLLVGAFVVGTALLGFIGVRMIAGQPARPTSAPIAQGPTVTETAPAASLTPTRKGPTFTPVPIVVAPTVAMTPMPSPATTQQAAPTATRAGGKGATPTATRIRSGGQATPAKASPTPTRTRGTAQRTPTRAKPTATPSGGKLPQTGVEMGAPLAGLALAGLASGAHWLRRRP